MNLTRSTLAAIALGAITVGCAQHTPPAPTSPSVPNSSPEVPPPNTNPNVPPGSPSQPNNPSPETPKDN
jgi:hypothetical protein